MYTTNLIENIAYDRKNRASRNTKQTKCRKDRSKDRSQWAHKAARTTAAEKFAAAFADEAAELREWNELRSWMFADAGMGIDEPVDADDADSKPELLDEQELAYWETVFQCA